MTDVIKYDDADWHFGGKGGAATVEAGAVHIAMFAAWAVVSGLASDYHAVECVDDLRALRDRSMTPVEWLLKCCDGKLTTEDLNDVGNRFALAIYGSGDGLHTEEGSYMMLYDTAVAHAAGVYEVPDNWHIFDRIAPLLDGRFRDWQMAEGVFP